MGGFDFSLKHRNEALVAAASARVPRAKKTGTTICGLIYKVRGVSRQQGGGVQARGTHASALSTRTQDGVVLGADTRATEDTTVRGD